MADKRSREEIATYAKYECLCCGHQDKIQGKRKDYSEVRVCPRCQGAFVDVYKIFKYKQDVKSIGTSVERGGLNIANTLKGLKAIQREARKATAGLKELEEQNKDKYLVIELDELGDVPRVLYKGEEISNKVKVGFNWDTANERYPSRQLICIDYLKKEDNGKYVRTGIHKLKGSRGGGDD